MRESFFEVDVDWNSCHKMAAAYTLVDRNKSMKKYVSHITSFTVTYFLRCCSSKWKERERNTNGHPRHIPVETKKTFIELYKD